MPETRPILRIASIPGDGIGIEVVEAALEVLKAAAQQSGRYDIEIERLPWGTAYYKESGSYLPDNFKSILQKHDAVLFGAVGAPGESFRDNLECSLTQLISVPHQMFLTTSLYGNYC